MACRNSKGTETVYMELYRQNLIWMTGEESVLLLKCSERIKIDTHP